MRSKRIGILVIALLVLATSAVIFRQRFRVVPAAHAKQPVGSVFEHEIVGEFPHETGAYTQGLIYLDGFLYESTGITGRSSVRKVRLETGKVVRERAVDPRDFGEGLTEWRGSLIQLTPRRSASSPPWHVRQLVQDIKRHFGDNVGVTYETSSLEPLSGFVYAGDGWGLTHDDHRLIMSDGSSKLRFLDPETFAESARLQVFDGDQPVENLNELEFVDGRIYANVRPQDRIAVIQPDTGQVSGWIDLSELKTRMPPIPAEPLHPVMNGIAYDAESRRLFVTGKLWPKIFEIRVRLP
jgi:glutamine cyclotransferase